ncbi:hypothetical protein P7L91_02285 [Bisgaard Taxon 10/6]|uniref:hypothetical protein n=1 Tax=Exercitatus varius TaxID=67857 RepID=UPI00294AE70B|nr:hypothetical protein [Exercitatus varius]MDG2959675.1 hypothetical protein [Exercitatus varius]
MRIIILVMILLKSSLIYAYECDDEFIKISKNINEYNITWCKSINTIQDNYFFLENTKDYLTAYKISHASIPLSKEESLEGVKNTQEKFCDKETLEKKIESLLPKNEIFFFTLIPSENNEIPYCYKLEMTYDGRDFSFIDSKSDIEIKKISHHKNAVINIGKQYLYNEPSKRTNMYLIKGDKVIILDKKTDNSGQKWYFINYKGKKDINMWIKAEAVDIKE